MSDNQEQKPDSGEAGSKKINLKVEDSNKCQINFKLEMSTPLKKLMKAYCQRMNLDEGIVRFLYDGLRISPNHTPKELGMEDGDIIDVAQEMEGGSF